MLKVKEKLLKNIVVASIAIILLTIFSILDLSNPLGFFDRINGVVFEEADEAATNYSRIVGIILLIFFAFFFYSFFNAILHMFSKDEKRIAKATDLVNTASVIPITIAIFIFIDFLFLSPVRVSGDSMKNTLHNNDILLTSHFITEKYDKDDIVIIKKRENFLIIKRVVAVQGDTISVTSNGVVTVNGEIIEDCYMSSIEYDNYTLEKDEFYCLGDNRMISSDSRSSGIFKRDQLCGRVILSIVPFNKDFTKNEMDFG